MPRQELNTQGGKSLASQLRPRGKRSGTGQVDSLWRGGPGSINVEFVVAAGGGGGAAWAGGGGGGGYRSSIPGESSGGGASAEPVLPVDLGVALTLTVGAGGAQSSNGSDSVFHNITSLGGGTTGSTGGSGGGGWGGAGASGTANQGYGGGTSTFTSDCNGNGRNPGGGGGGAGGAGESSFTSGGYQYSGQGGAAVSTNATGTSLLHGAGGNAGARSSTSDNQGCNYRRTRSQGEGSGGHEGHGDCGGRTVGTSGSANYASGGGGIPYAYAPAGEYQGGSGRVIVRWLTGTATATVSAGITYTSGTTGLYSFINCTSGSGTVTFN